MSSENIHHYFPVSSSSNYVFIKIYKTSLSVSCQFHAFESCCQSKKKTVEQNNSCDRIEESHVILFKAVNFCICLICLCLVCSSDGPLSFTLLLDFELSPCHISAFVYACTADYSMSLCLYLIVYMCVCTYVCIHACWCQLQRTSGRHYII